MTAKKATKDPIRVGTAGPSVWVDVVAISRSQNIRVGTGTVPPINGRLGNEAGDITPLRVDLENSKARRDLQNHLAFGAVLVVGSSWAAA